MREDIKIKARPEDEVINAVIEREWSMFALGTISAALIGLIAYKQVISVTGWIAIFIMCAGIAILNLFGTPKEEKGGNGKKNGGDVYGGAGARPDEGRE